MLSYRAQGVTGWSEEHENDEKHMLGIHSQKILTQLNTYSKVLDGRVRQDYLLEERC